MSCVDVDESSVRIDGLHKTKYLGLYWTKTLRGEVKSFQ